MTAMPRFVPDIQANDGTSSALNGFDVASVRGDYTAPPYLLKNTLQRGEILVMFGDSGVMKSFVAIDISMHVGLGLDWNGFTCRRAGVLYVCGEGGAGVRKRFRAWMIANEVLENDDQPDVYVTTEPADLIGDPGQLGETIRFAADALGRSIDLVVIDTLSANFGEGDESRTDDVHRVLRNLQTVTGGAAVLLVHHVGHGDKTRERGAYAMRAAADRRWLVERPDPGELIAVKFLKAKDEALASGVVMRWQTVPLGWFDGDGDELTSVALELSDGEMPRPTAVITGKAQKAVMIALRSSGGMTKSALVQALAAEKIAKRSVYSSVEGLLREGHIEEVFTKLVVSVK